MLMMGKPTNTPPIDFRRCFLSIAHTAIWTSFCNMDNGLLKKHDLYNLVIIHRQFNKNFIGFCFYVTICFCYNIETSPSIKSCGPEAKFKEKCENDKFRFPKRTDRLIWIILFWISFAAVARWPEWHWAKNNYSAFCSSCPCQFPVFWQKSIKFYIIVTDFYKV